MTRKSRLMLIPALAAVVGLTLAGCSTPTTAEKPASEADAPVVEEVVEEDPAPEEGTRNNPYPIGTAITSGDWTITIDNVNLAANDVIATNEFNEPAAEGNTYVLVTATVAYNGNDPAGEIPMGQIDFVTADGNTIMQAWVDTTGSGAQDFSLLTELYEGATHSGALAFEVPEVNVGEGTLAVQPDLLGDKAFVAVQ